MQDPMLELLTVLHDRMARIPTHAIPFSVVWIIRKPLIARYCRTILTQISKIKSSRRKCLCRVHVFECSR